MTLTLQIDAVLFRNLRTGFCIFRGVDDADCHFTAKGILPNPMEGEVLRLHGRETGGVVEFNEFEAVHPSSREMHIRFLGSGMCPGLGPRTLQKIREHDQGRTLTKAVNENLQALHVVPGVGQKTIDGIRKAVQDNLGIRSLCQWLRQMEAPLPWAIPLYQRYGKDAEKVLAEDPYRAYFDVPDLGFRRVDQLGQSLGFPLDYPDRSTAAVAAQVQAGVDNGNVYVPLDELSEALRRKKIDHFQDALLRLEGTLVVNGDRVYRKNLWDDERSLAIQLRMLQGAGTLSPSQALAYQSHTLDSDQNQALLQALIHKVAVITGGPGTGKSSACREITRALVKLHKRIALCAPTGRAARRLHEATRFPACTLHRLLEFDPYLERFNRNSDYPLDCDVVITDEATMIDLPLFTALLRAVDSKRTALVLVGDVDQLPSVGPGRVFADLCEHYCSGHPAVSVSYLTHNHRQGLAQESFLQVARALRDGRRPEIMSRPPTFVPTHCTTGDEIRDSVLAKMSERNVDVVQILCSTRKGRAGTVQLNQGLQGKVNSLGKPVVGFLHETDLRVGDKVIQTNNNYRLGVYNGDVGRIESFQDGEARVRFPYQEGLVTYDWTTLEGLELAYAVTSHKGQGSEYPFTWVCLDPAYPHMLTRNLVYTALTRARRGTSLSADLSLLREGLPPETRYSGLKERL